MKKEMIRQLDPFGRVVIPREIRANLNLKTSSPLKIKMTENNELVLTPIVTNNKINELAQIILRNLKQITKYDYICCDLNTIVAVTSGLKYININAKISNELKNIFQKKNQVKTNRYNNIKLIENKNNIYNIYAFPLGLLNNTDYLIIVILDKLDNDIKIDNFESLIKLAGLNILSLMGVDSND